MSRLTKKDYKNGIQVNGYYTKKNAQRLTDISHKLGKLEDIEDELGCPLETVFRAMKNGIEYQVKITSISVSDDDNERKETIRIEHRTNLKTIELKYGDSLKEYVFVVPYDVGRYDYHYDFVYLKDYQKTWWVKGEKLCC